MKEGKGQSSDYFGNCYLMTGQGVRRGLGNIIFVCLLNEECEQPIQFDVLPVGGTAVQIHQKIMDGKSSQLYW